MLTASTCHICPRLSAEQVVMGAAAHDARETPGQPGTEAAMPLRDQGSARRQGLP